MPRIAQRQGATLQLIGKLEAIDGKTGALQHNAYGYRDDEYLKPALIAG